MLAECIGVGVMISESMGLLTVPIDSQTACPSLFTAVADTRRSRHSWSSMNCQTLRRRNRDESHQRRV